MSRNKEILFLGLILLLAALLRMAAPGLTEFKADEARLFALALDMAEGDFALRGISSSVGFPNFPASVWIYAIPLVFWPHPAAATLFTGLLNTLAIAAGYWFVRRYWGVTGALAATLMIAVSPWAVIFSRKIWAQNLLPIFVIGWVIGAALALVEEKPRFIWLHLICLALAVQIHLAAIALFPATLLLLLVFYKRINWRSLLIGGLLAFLTVIPFIIFLGERFKGSGFPNIAGGEGGFSFSWDSAHYLAMISLGIDIHSLAGPEKYLAYLAQVPGMTIVQWIWGLLILAGIIWFGWQAWNRREERPAQVGFIVLVWLLAPTIFFLGHTTPVFLHYFIATLPAQYIVAGVFFSRIPDLLGSRSKPIISVTAWGVLILTAVLQARAFLILLGIVSTNATPGGFGVPLAMKMQVVETIGTLMQETGAAEVLVAGQGEYPIVDAFPAEWAVLLRDYPHRFVDANSAALFPAQASVVLLDGRETSTTWTGDLYMAAAADVRDVALREGEGFYHILSIPEEVKPTPSVVIEPPHLLANWVNINGYDPISRHDESSGIWQLHWRTGDNPDPQAYQFFNHLFAGNGARIGQVDAPAFSPGHWRAGDQLISRFLLPWPENASDPLSIRVGMYKYPSLENVPLLDEAGNPYVDAATFSMDNESQ